jgi:hypothetical protein
MNPEEKTFGISFISNEKNWCIGKISISIVVRLKVLKPVLTMSKFLKREKS